MCFKFYKSKPSTIGKKNWQKWGLYWVQDVRIVQTVCSKLKGTTQAEAKYKSKLVAQAIIELRLSKSNIIQSVRIEILLDK